MTIDHSARPTASSCYARPGGPGEERPRHPSRPGSPSPAAAASGKPESQPGLKPQPPWERCTGKFKLSGGPPGPNAGHGRSGSNGPCLGSESGQSAQGLEAATLFASLSRSSAGSRPPAMKFAPGLPPVTADRATHTWDHVSRDEPVAELVPVADLLPHLLAHHSRPEREAAQRPHRCGRRTAAAATGPNKLANCPPVLSQRLRQAIRHEGCMRGKRKKLANVDTQKVGGACAEY